MGLLLPAAAPGLKDLHKKVLNDPDNHDDVITYLEPDILEKEVKWALGRITSHAAEAWLRGATPHPRSEAAAENARLQQRRSG